MSAPTGRRTPNGSEMTEMKNTHDFRDSAATLQEELDITLFDDQLWLSNSIYHFKLFGDDEKTLKSMEKDEEKHGDSPHSSQAGKDLNLVTWNGPDDPGNPMNWPLSKKLAATITYSFLTFVITFASSVFSTATEVTAVEFGVSAEVMVLGTSLFVLVSGDRVSRRGYLPNFGRDLRLDRSYGVRFRNFTGERFLCSLDISSWVSCKYLLPLQQMLKPS